MQLPALHRRRAEALGAEASLLADVEERPAHTQDGDRLSTLLGFVDRLTLSPVDATPEHLQQLLAQDLDVPAIVTLAQLVAFSNYQVRLLAGLRALGAGTAAAQPGAVSTNAEPGHHTLPAARPRGAYTQSLLQWRAWLPPPVLRGRSRLFNAIMYSGEGGLPRAERELATVAVSRINGCTYCASVHARFFTQLTQEQDAVEGLLQHGVNSLLPPPRRGLVDLAVDLTANPPAIAAGRLQAPRAQGLSELALLDAIHAAAIFAWANRLMQTLGEPTGPGQPA